MGVDKARDKGGFADALGTEDDDFRFEGVWGLWRSHVFDVQSWVVELGCKLQEQKDESQLFVIAFQQGSCVGCPQCLA